MSVSSKVAEFILTLLEDIEALRNFEKNPDEVLTAAGIVDEETRGALKSWDIFKIQKLLADQKFD